MYFQSACQSPEARRGSRGCQLRRSGEPPAVSLAPGAAYLWQPNTPRHQRAAVTQTSVWHGG